MQITIHDVHHLSDLVAAIEALTRTAREQGEQFFATPEHVLSRQTQSDLEPEPEPELTVSSVVSATNAVCIDSVAQARAHKRRVRASATARSAQIALLFLADTDELVSAQAERDMVRAAWDAAKQSLGHQEFVRTHPATLADLRALAG